MIKESSGLGFSGSIVSNWICDSIENAFTIEKLGSGMIVDVPERIASYIHNVVDVETGKIVSRKYSLNNVTIEQIKERYQKLAGVESIKANLKEIFPLDSKLKDEINLKEI